MTIVVAPAGYGKSTLLAQAVADNEAAPRGIDCRMACEPGVTAESLGASLCRAVGAARPLADRAGACEVVEAVTDAMWGRSPQEVALLVDDVHEIAAGSGAGVLLAELVAALPANGHVVLAGRRQPDLALARLEVEGHVARLDDADLAFTPDEVARFAALRGVPESKLAACGGWPALAELSASATSDVTGDYLDQEVLARLAPAGRRALAVLAHLGPFDDELARAALGAETDVACLVAGIPLVTSLGGGVQRLHPLWQTLLAGEATQDDVAAARRRAAAVFLARRDAGSAVPLLIDAEAWDDLAQAVVTALGPAHPPVPQESPAVWYARLPSEARAAPGGQLLAALVTAEADPEGAWDRLAVCAVDFRAAGDAAGELACLVQMARIAWWSEEPERLASLGFRILQLEAGGCEEAVALACIARALIADVQNDDRQTIAELDRVPPGSLSETWQGVVGWLRAAALLMLGDAERALAAAEEALARAGDLHAPLAQGIRIQALWYQGRVAEAVAAMAPVLRRLKELGYRTHTALAAAQCTVAHALRGEPDQAEECMALARLEAVDPDAPLVETNLAIAEAALAVTAGDEVAATAGLTACLKRHPLREGLSAGAHMRNLALIYVLAPATRPAWEAAELGPAFLVARHLARAVTAVRERRPLPADTPPLPDATIVRAHLPLRWTAELAVAAVDAGRDDGWSLLDQTWPDTRPAVLELARRARHPLRRAAATVAGRLPVPPTARLELRVLGPIELRRDGVLVDAADWRRERVRSLLAYLALHGMVSRARLADDLWPGLDRDAQSRNLRVTLSYLLRVLEPERGPRDPSFFVRQHGGNLTLHPGLWLTVDVHEFDALCQRAADADAQGSPAVALDHALRAADLWRGDPAELSDPWAVTALEQRRSRFAATATRAGELLLARGNIEGAHALAERALALDPWLEAGHRLVVAAHRASGDDLAARRALARYHEAVRDLGFTPGEATRMVERLLDAADPAPLTDH